MESILRSERQGNTITVSDINSIFVDADENTVAVLGDKYLHDFLKYGVSHRGFCVVTDRRLYCRGKCYRKAGGAYTADVCRLVVDVRDIGCTGTQMARITGILLVEAVAAIMWFLLIALGVAAVNRTGYAGFDVQDMEALGLFLLILVPAAGALYYGRKKLELFVIKYAGDEIAFLTSEYSSNEMQLFERKLHQIKNKISA